MLPPSSPWPILSLAASRALTNWQMPRNTHSPSTGRFLRALTSLGIFVEDTTGRYRQTALSDALRSDHPESIRPWAMMRGAHFVWKPSGMLEEAVRTGRPSFERVYGADGQTVSFHSQESQLQSDRRSVQSVPTFKNPFLAKGNRCRLYSCVGPGRHMQ